MKILEEMSPIAKEMQGYLHWLQDEGIDIWKQSHPISPLTPPELPNPEIAGFGDLFTLEMVRAEMGDCQRCKLAPSRTNLVFGIGDPKAELMFVGEAPGMDEDVQGEPFVGKAGQLLTKMIAAMGLSRERVYIANIIKCRPPQNRNPEPDEIASCRPFLDQQIAAIGPKVICALGKFSAQTLLNTETRISDLRGKFYDLNGVKVLPTFHPAYLLRNPGEKKRVWEDLQVIMAELNLPREGRK